MTTMIEVDRMDGHAFEYFCAQLLAANGFSNIDVTKASGDQGVDIVATKDEIKYAIQCKCYSDKLGNRPIQEVYAGKAYYHCDKAVVMTNSSFTPGAYSLANATNVALWDRNRLQQMLDVFNGKTSGISAYSYDRNYTQQSYNPKQQGQKERTEIVLDKFLFWAKVVCLLMPVMCIVFVGLGGDGFIAIGAMLLGPFVLPFISAEIMQTIGWIIFGEDVYKYPFISLCAYGAAFMSLLSYSKSEQVLAMFLMPSVIIIGIHILKFLLIKAQQDKQ